jgi:phospholipid/cholesterol/gamma-HCH transport system substrate-binding protein
METRVPHWSKLVLPGAFALACVILTLVVFHVFGGALPLEAQGYRVKIPLPQAANLVPGSGVQIAGVKVGRAVGVARAGNGARVTVELQRKFAPLRSGASAIARTKTLLGEGYLELAPGSRSARPIPDGGELAAKQVRPAVQLDEFLSTFAPATRTRLRDAFGGLSTALAGREQALNDSLGNAAPFTGSLLDVLRAVDGQRTDLRGVISSSADVLQAVGERQGALRAAVTAGDDALAVTARRNRELAATVHALPGFLSQLHRTADTISAASPDLNAAVASLLPIAPLVAPALAQIRTAAPEFRALFADLPATLAAGRQGLPALTRIVRAARVGFQQFYPTARELIPFMQLFGANKRVIDILANVASVSSGSYVGPGGTVVGYATGLPTVWNETISGWAKKLPTNRQNPYPKPPDGLLDTGKLGVLRAYDCRNTGNVLYLPPIGAAPPCILQGPWSFNGKSAFYPRLTLTPP